MVGELLQNRLRTVGAIFQQDWQRLFEIAQPYIRRTLVPVETIKERSKINETRTRIYKLQIE